MTNKERAKNGRKLAQLALGGGEMDEDDFTSGLADALANLMHFARRHHLDFELALNLASAHHETESRHGWKAQC